MDKDFSKGEKSTRDDLIPNSSEEGLVTTPLYFYSVSGLKVAGVNPQQFEALIDELQTLFYISLRQVVEAGAYSFSMVARHALGQTAEQSVMGVVADCSLPGLIALNAARYLFHAGAAVTVVILNSPNLTDNAEVREEFARSVKSLNAIGIATWQADTGDDSNLVTCLRAICERSQTILMGCHQLSAVSYLKPLSFLNETICSVHVVQMPLGTDPSTGKGLEGAIFASSTLSLGVPLRCLSYARQRVGRHYICDISLPTSLVDIEGNRKHLFHDQPVQTLLFDMPTLSH